MGFRALRKQVLAAGLAVLAFAGAASAAEPVAINADHPIAIISAFPPEFKALVGAIQNPQSQSINGMTYVTGTLEGKPVVLMTSGVSMVNAAMNTQLVIDRFHVSRIVFSGIAGGVDPSLAIGDVVAPEQWGQPLEVIMARETPQGYAPPSWQRHRQDVTNFGMMYPRQVAAGNNHAAVSEQATFAADPGLLAVARQVAATEKLSACAAQACLDHAPQVVVGGVGVSTPAFVDNAAYRSYLYTAFHARLTDMETAAVAQVAYANEVPFIGFRSLSDLAGGDAHTNQMATFMSLASTNSAQVVIAFVKALP